MRLAFLIAALAATPAMAVDIPAPRPQANAGAAAAASSTAAAWSQSNAFSGAVAGAQGGTSYATGGQGGLASIVFNQPGTVRYDFGGSIKTVPDVAAPNLAPGSQCQLSVTFGAGLIGAGVSGGITYESDICNRQKEAEMLWNMGQRVAAVEHLKLHIPEVGETFAKLEGAE